ncbi:MAG: AAA family ATPase [Prevotella sp.]|nr:AAA family ATPase [Prevotella sp.]
MDCAEQIGNYLITSEPTQLSPNLYFFENCENNEGVCFDILTIKETDSNLRKLRRIIDNEIKPLVNQDIVGFVKTIETGFDDATHSYYIVYEHFADNTYETLQNIDIASVINITKGLNYFKTNNNTQKFVISPQYVKVDNTGDAKLMFAILYDIFADENLLDEEYLSPNAKKYLSDRTSAKPTHQDDIYALVKTFESFIRDNYEYSNVAITNKILSGTLEEERTKRFSKYHELIDLLEQLPSVNRKSYQTIKVVTQPDFFDAFQAVLNSMNKNTWMLIDYERSEQGQVTGQFTTDDYCGRFFVDEKGYLFIPYKSCKNGKNKELVSKEDSFLAEFNFSLNDNWQNFNCVNYYEQKYQERHRLSQLHKIQNDNLNVWLKLPETEKEYIEKNAFKVKYVKKEPSQNNECIIFTLTEDEKISWGKVRKLKDEHKILFVDDIFVGQIYDWKSESKTITIANPKCNIEELPENGELSEDIRQETSQFKKQVESCQKFLKQDVVNKELCDIIATPNNKIDCRIHDLDYDTFESQLYNEKLKNDPSQLEAVLEAISYKPMYLIQGPPGAGKTTVIVETIRQLVKRQKDIKILLTSQSNLAVDNVLEKLIDCNDIPFIRLASENALENDSVSELMKHHCYEEKLKQWIAQTEKKSSDYFDKNFAEQEGVKELQKLFDTYMAAKESNNFSDFTKRLNKCSNYVKKLFENANDFKSAEKVFESKFGKEYFLLKKIQKDWFSFIDNSLVDADSDGKRKKAMLNNGSQEIDFLTAMLLKTNVVGATCIHIASSKYSRVNFKFDYVIMDESSKATPAESLVPLSMGRNIIMIGDDKQLPPVITREDAVKQDIKDKLEDEGLDIDKTYGVSLFEKIKRAFEQSDYNRRYVKMLDTQYRMPKQIGSLISDFFYDGKLNNPDFEGYDESKRHGLNIKKQTSIVFLSTSSYKDCQDNGVKDKRHNQCNVNVIKELLAKINDLYPDNLQKETPFSIGVIAGYRGQVELLKQQIKPLEYSNFVCNKKPLIECNTVDKFQGAERDIIIYDIVRSSIGQDNIGFLADYRRINVAFSRAKRLLIIVGDSEYILKRASFTPSEDFPEFKLKLITEKLKSDGLIFNNLNDIFNG